MGCDEKTDMSQKITHEYNKLNSTEVEDVLEFFSTFNDIMKTLALPEGSQRFRLIPAMMGHDAKKNGSILWRTTAKISPNKNSNMYRTLPPSIYGRGHLPRHQGMDVRS
jgi:hypothetical protein